MLEEFWDKYRERIVEYGGHIAGAFILLVLGWLAVRFVLGPLRRVLQRSGMNPVIASYVTGLAHSAFIIFLVLAVLSQLGVETTSLIALVGAAGLAVGLSLQGLMSNFTAGLLILS